MIGWLDSIKVWLNVLYPYIGKLCLYLDLKDKFDCER